MRLIQLISKNLANFLKAFLTKLFSCIFAIKISKTTHYFIDQKTFEISCEKAFSAIIKLCATASVLLQKQ